jgi:two-component system response regulator HydG
VINFNRVLAIGAHPDDVEFSCLGYLMKLKENGSKIIVYIASNGSAGDPTSSVNRIDESRNALHCIGAELFYRNQSGISIEDYEKISAELRLLILENRPDLILIHSQFDTHQEHKYLRDILMTASRRVPCSIISYKSVSVTVGYEENLFININKYIDKKIEYVRMHKSQRGHEYMSEESIRLFHVNWFAKMRASDYVESFHVEQIIG